MVKLVTSLLACTVCFVAPWEDMISIPGIGTLSKFIVPVFVVMAALKSISSSNVPRIPAITLLSAYVAWCIATYFWSFDPSNTTIRSITLVSILMMTLSIVISVDKESDIHRIAKWFVYGSIISAISTIQSFLVKSEAVYQRYAASGFDPNDLGLILSIAIAFCGIATKAPKSRLESLVLNVAPFLMAGAVLLTASRASFLTASIALFYVLLTRMKGSIKAKVAYSLAVALFIYFLPSIIPNTSFNRLQTISSEIQDGNLNNRSDIWRAAINVNGDHFFAGVGSGAFPQAITKYYPYPIVAHNMFISVLVETGMVGLLLFLAIILLCIYSSFKISSFTSRTLLVSCIVLLIGTSALSWEHRKSTWIVLSLMMSCGYIGKLGLYDFSRVLSRGAMT